MQSIAPVRREWLDRFASDLLIVEGLRYAVPGVTEVQEIARRQGRMMNEIEAESRALDAVSTRHRARPADVWRLRRVPSPNA